MLLERDVECRRWGTYEEKIRKVHSELHSKEIKKNVEKKIESILKESGMTRKEFNEIKGIALEMKANGKTKVLVAIPIANATPSVELRVVGTTSHISTTPYAIVLQV